MRNTLIAIVGMVILATLAHFEPWKPDSDGTKVYYDKEFASGIVSLRNESGKILIPETKLPALAEGESYGSIELPGCRSLKKGLQLTYKPDGSSTSQTTFSFRGENYRPTIHKDKWLVLHLETVAWENNSLAQLRMSGERWEKKYFYPPGKAEEGEKLRQKMEWERGRVFYSRPDSPSAAPTPAPTPTPTPKPARGHIHGARLGLYTELGSHIAGVFESPRGRLYGIEGGLEVARTYTGKVWLINWEPGDDYCPLDQRVVYMAQISANEAKGCGGKLEDSLISESAPKKCVLAERIMPYYTAREYFKSRVGQRYLDNTHKAMIRRQKARWRAGQ